MTIMAKFVDTPDQEELARAARTVVSRRLPVAHLRGLRERSPAERVDRALWRELAELGWAGILIDDAHGGAGLGMVEVGLVMLELGRTLAATPMLSTAVIGASALAGTQLAAEILPAVGRGERLLALAFEERNAYAPDACATRLGRGGGGLRLDGDKVNVLDGPAADQLLIVARDDRDARVIVVVDRDAPGVTIAPLARVDSRSAANVQLRGVPVDEARVLHDVELERVLARATAALTAEMLGGADAVFAITIEYLKQRRQFGVPIGSFQALKHRAAHLFCELELTRSIVRAALVSLDHDPLAAAEILVSAAKARATDTFLLAAAEAVQMHGGIGVTDELDVGLYYKRARAAELTLGSAAYHRDRFARLQGY